MINKCHFSYVHTNFSRSGKASMASKHNFVNANDAWRRRVVVSKIVLKRTRSSYSVRSDGICVNNFSSLARSSGVRSLGSRRNSHICERNSFRSAGDNFALCCRVIFFSLAVDGVVPQLGHMKTINYSSRLGQEPSTNAVVRRTHVHPIAPHPGTLRRRQTFQALG